MNREIEFYVLCLFKYADDAVVFLPEELQAIGQGIKTSLNEAELLKSKSNGSQTQTCQMSAEWFVFDLDNSKVKNCACTYRPSATLGYYHHRLILNLVYRADVNFEGLRNLRKQAVDLANYLIREHVVPQINAAHRGRASSFVKSWHIYPLILVSGPASGRVADGSRLPFTHETSSLTFNLLEYKKSLSFQPTVIHSVRISVPSTIVYSRTSLSTSLRRNLINALYEYCLYRQREVDGDRVNGPQGLKEAVLVELWEHMMDHLGGRPCEVDKARLSYWGYMLGVSMALVVSALSFLLGRLLP